MARTFTVIYRTGGTVNAKWHKCLPQASISEAREQLNSIERMGYAARIFDTQTLENVGMPEGYAA